MKSLFKRRNIAFLVYGVLIIVFIAYSIDATTTWRHLWIWRSPKVCITPQGEKYHECYHYADRNRELSLFEAVVDKNRTPCAVCNPPDPDDYEADKPAWIFRHWLISGLLLSYLYLMVYAIFFQVKEE